MTAPERSLDAYGAQVVEDAAGHFADRLDGPDYGPALEAALTEAYLRGVTHGRLAEAADAKAKAQAHERAAEELVAQAGAALGHPDAAHTILRHLAQAQEHLTFARALRAVAGSR
jgi:hypothetical protein